jgi:tRNA (guanine-N7-)-methyltransferase
MSLPKFLAGTFLIYMGKNKLQKFSDMSRWDNVFEFAQYDKDENDNYLKGNWATKVFGNNNPVVLELGCGKGEYAVALAELYPDVNFIGIDLKGSRMWTGAKEANDKDLNNVVFLRTHIEFISRFFAEDEISEIWLTFPDPQMKKARKRLTSTRFLKLYSSIMKVGGKIHLKTDSTFMYKYTSEVIRLNQLNVLFSCDDLYHSDWNDKILSIQTFYEKQWLMRGLNIKYIQFNIDNKNEWIEPETEIEPDSYRSFGRSARNIYNVITIK